MRKHKNIYMGSDSTAKLPIFGRVDTGNEIALNAIATAYDSLNSKMLTRQLGLYDETSLIEDENGEIKVIFSSRVIFGCKPMWLDLVGLGIHDFKNHGSVPHIVKDLIYQVINENPKSRLIDTNQGRLALNFLMGFYDGDGNHRGGMAARILNSKKEFLEEIVKLYKIPNRVFITRKKKIDKKTQKIVWKSLYQISLGPE